ncbi:carboxymuconolactone decarboxylase family protein [Streptomyces luteogriseus]
MEPVRGDLPDGAGALRARPVQVTVRTRLLDPAVGRALLATWEEAAGVFDERERAAPALTEAVTVLTDGFVPDEVYERAARHFDETRPTHLVGLVVAINNWNRVMVSRRIPPGGYRP